MKKYVIVPEDINFIGASAGGMSFDTINECMKAINFLLKVGCSFTCKGEYEITLNNAMLKTANWSDHKSAGWDLLILLL